MTICLINIVLYLLFLRFYFLIQFEAAGSVIADYELMMKRDERVLRFLTVRMDADHVTYAEKRRAKTSAN